MDAEWLIPFKGRNSSETYNQNFLWRSGNIYIMDNHRAALWCWCQHICKDMNYNLLHIDRHYDALTSRVDEWVTHLPDPWTASLETMLECSYNAPDIGGWAPVLRWDNYLSLLIQKYPSIVDSCYCATCRNDRGDRPRTESLIDWDWDNLVSCCESLFRSAGTPWICNVDLDYFFCCYDDEEATHRYIETFSDTYILHIFTVIRNAIDRGEIAVFTMALSPECCGGWANTERLAGKICRIMGIPFNLPAE